ncbi:MAG: hypothetical protein SCALA702_21660 [Melioribacteraceae bacterium]|nr:MAG: hypothetical protein SCALA702_21660 [Melioribacteraceae bacterium]
MKIAIIFTLILLTISCTQKPDLEKEKQNLINTDKEFSDYAQENGVGNAFVLYADSNAIMLPNGGQPIKGISSVEEAFKEYKSLLQWEPEFADVSASGDLGYTWGRYVTMSRAEDGEYKRTYGKYTSIWKKQKDGTWKWVLDTGNSNPATDKQLAADRVKFDPSRDAEQNIADAIAEASKTGKKILLDVGGEWCIWCHKMDLFIKRHEALDKAINDKFVVVKVNYSKENKNEEVLSRYPEVTGYPHLFVLDSNGDFLHSQNTAELEKNKAYDLDKFLEFVNKF